MISHSFASTF